LIAFAITPRKAYKHPTPTKKNNYSPQFTSTKKTVVFFQFWGYSKSALVIFSSTWRVSLAPLLMGHGVMDLADAAMDG